MQSLGMGESTFTCTFCNKEFANKSRLEMHLKVHTGEKTHICSQCNRAFRTASDLKVHFRTHTGEKPYKCKFCDQAFAVSRNLTAHTRIHTGERPFVCSLCGKAFTQKSALNVHMRIHTGDKPFQCIFCAKQFAYSNSLKMHLKEHTREAPHNNSSSQSNNVKVSTSLVTPTIPTSISSHLSGHKRGRVSHRGSRRNCRKREPFKQEIMLGFSDYSQTEEENLYTCSICSQGFDQIQVLAEHWKSHNEESDSEKSENGEELGAGSLSSNMPTTAESSLAQGRIKIEAGISEESSISNNNAFDKSALCSEKDVDANQSPSIYNNLREIIAKSLTVPQIKNGQRPSKTTSNQENHAVTFGSAAKLCQPSSLLRGYQTSKSSSDRIFGRLKHNSLVSDSDEMLESPTFQSPLGVDSASSTRVSNENLFGSLASITEKVKEDTDVGFFSSPNLSGSFYMGNSSPEKKCQFPPQNDSTTWEDYPNNSTCFNNPDNKNIALEQINRTLNNDNPAFQSVEDLKPFDCSPLKQKGSKSSCLIDSKLDIASLFDQDIYTSALNDALKSLPSNASTSFLNSNNSENTDLLLSNSADAGHLHETQEPDSAPSFMPTASTIMASSSMPSIMSMIDNSQLDLLTNTSTPTTTPTSTAAVTTQSDELSPMVHTYKCNLCSMVFCDSTIFTEHLDKHSKSSNPFMCTECGKQCGRQYDLKVHARTHTGERPYKCKFCNRGFAISRNLVAHLRIHTGERPYKCETCDKSFTQQSALRTHSRIHTGEKPYLCKACGKKFAYSYVLNSHLRNSKLNRCNYCEGMYVGACAMAQHMKSHEVEDNKHDPLLLEKKAADKNNQLAKPTNKNASKKPTNSKPKKNANKKVLDSIGGDKVNNMLPDLASEFQDQPIPNLNCSDILQNSDLLSKLDDQSAGLEVKEDNSTKESGFFLPIKSESLLDSFLPDENNGQLEECENELDKIFVDSLNTTSTTTQNSEQSLPKNPAQSGGFGGKLNSYLKYAKHLSQRHHAMISRKVKARPRTYVCWHCRQTFGLFKDLSKHMMDHWKKKKKRKYSCQHCFRMFTKQDASIVHQQIHKSKKQFKCDLCSKRFVFLCNLKSHKKCRHSLQYRFKPFNCQHCLQSFGRYYFYSTHIKLSHPEISPKTNPQNSLADTKLLMPKSDLDSSSLNEKNCLAPVKIEENLIPPSNYQRENSENKTDFKNSKDPVVTNPVKQQRGGCQKDNPIVVYVNDSIENDDTRKDQLTAELSDPNDTTNENASNSGGCNFSCTFCDRTFNRRHQLIVHLRIHTGEKPYKCTWCQKAFRVSNDLNVHTRIHTGYRPYNCKLCNKTFTVLRNLSTHMRVHTGEKPFQCNVCAKRFSQKSALTVHQRIHTGSKPFKCEQCPQSFAHSSSLQQHKRRHENDHFEDKEYWCTICRQAFIDYSELVAHVKTHSNEDEGLNIINENKFPACSDPPHPAESSTPDYHPPTIRGNYGYQNAEGLDKDQTTVPNNQQLIDIDGAIQAIKSEPESINIMESLKFKALTDNNHDKRPSLQSPMPALSNENVKKEPEYLCSSSQQRKSVSQELEPEAMMHPSSDMDPSIPSSNFGENFYQERKFQPLEENDNGVSGSYSCDDCGKVFNEKCNLETHSRIHTQEKSHLCQFCNKSFQNANDLKVHLQNHAGERPYKCDVCSQGLSFPRDLIAHMRIHTGERPFKCEYCDKQFTQKSALTVHIRIHTGAKPFKCQHCDQTFAYSYSLNVHCKQQHKTNAETHGTDQGAQSTLVGKVFKCGECNQTFARASMLSVHRRIHKPQNQNPGRRQESDDIFVTPVKPSEEYLSLYYDESQLSEMAEMQTGLDVTDFDRGNPVNEEASPENDPSNYQSQIARFSIVDRMNLRSKQPEFSKSSSDQSRNDSPAKEFSQEIFDMLQESSQQDLSELQDAGNISSQGGESVCNVCGKSFNQRAHLNSHYRIHTGERPYKCRFCTKAFRVRSDLTVHVRTHTGERPYKCRFCPKAFSISRNLTAHLRTHTGERPFPCQHCNKRFTQKSALTVHLRTHTGVRPYVCIQCGSTFAYSHSLKVHMSNHNKSNSLNSTLDDIEGLSPGNSLNSTSDKPPRKHQKIVQDENLNHISRNRKQASTKRGTLNAEQQSPPSTPTGTSNNFRPYSCQMCGKYFMQNSQLVAHLRIHSGERPYPCRWCSKTFRISSDLTVHQRVHTGEKPYKCEQCGKTFSISRNLITHMRTHTGERPFPCPCCNKRFTQKSALTVHMRIHTGATPYKCNACLQTFAYSSCLSLHKKHKKAIECNQCGEVLLGKCAFRSHMQTHETDQTFLTRE